VQLADVILLGGAGLVAGAVNAIAGGGSLLLFPALVASGYGTLPANVTNSVALWPGYLGGAVGFREELRGQRARLIRLALTTVAGAVTGCVLLLSTPDSAFDAVVPFLVFGASLLLALQPRVSRLVGEPREEGRPAVLYPAVFVAAAYGGYFGGALGVILLGVLALTIPDTLRRLNGLKAELSLMVASVTVVAFGIFGPVDWVAVAILAPITLLGGFLGARLARRVPDRALRLAVVVFGVVVAVLLFLRNR